MTDDKPVKAFAKKLDEHPALRKIKRVVVAVIGGTVLLFGVALLVLPGPAFIVIPVGLAILAIEFEWSRRWLRKAKSLLGGEQKK